MDRDHPRSRGVYLPSSVEACIDAGSSPLARGLRIVSLIIVIPFGIIPARAGFTVRMVTLALLSTDHPRSRGVYCVCVVLVCVRVGSSPLARGLPIGTARIPAPRRIIPARAGFTDTADNFDTAVGDHPRSRGVYRVA